MPTHLKLKVEELQSSLEALSESDRRFASSLCEQFWKREKPLSPKQELWVDRLLERAQKPKMPEVKIGSMTGLLALFAKARQHLKWPAVVLAVEVAETWSHPAVVVHAVEDKKQRRTRHYFFARLTVAGEQAKIPGSVSVTTYEVERSTGRRAWLGRVLVDGTWQPTADAPTMLADRLTALAERPSEVAAEHGTLTGRCCFCNTALSDERSTAVGYGKICADHFGLKWGARPDEFAGAA